MLNSLYIKAASKRGSIKEAIPELEGDSVVFNNWDDKTIISSDDEFSIGAGDGSFNKKKFLGFNFYAVSAESLIFDGQLKRVEQSDIDKFPYLSYLDEFLSNYMSIFELKCCLSSLEEYNVDYYLVDGSIYGDLQNPFPKGVETSAKDKKNLISATLNDFEDMVKNAGDKSISSPKLFDRYFRIYEEQKYPYTLYLTTIEKLVVLKEILKNPKKMIAISKSSSNNDIFHTNVPDIAIFDKYTSKQGISKIIRKKVSVDINTTFPVYDEFFKELKFTIFYLRLADYKNVLKVELPYDASMMEIEEIASKLKKFSINGYPYLLKKAHNDVVISDNNIRELINIAKVREKSGREML
ncbi:DNA double-strand break repair nuclease NurA [uncultured Methanobrevibacter sp.]|uniref:DNA double-strand break repair nuclease NurA n=1 Tax=uncultured Methanobrevibacter sp. TaxID=253161 RepID=UPI00262BAF68|nr:DNA double-strand break repair nuclease NurA [uncultured Methanobrevibacter sp.]